MLSAASFTRFSQLPKPALDHKQRFSSCSACSSNKVPIVPKSAKLLVCSTCESTVGPVKVNGVEYVLPRLDHFHLPKFLGLDTEKVWRITGLEEWKDITISEISEKIVSEPVRIFDGSCDICQAIFPSGSVNMCDTCEDFHFCTKHKHSEHGFHSVENVNTGLMQFDGVGVEPTRGKIPTNLNMLIRGLLLAELSDPKSVHVKYSEGEYVLDTGLLEPNRSKAISSVTSVLTKWDRDWLEGICEQVIVHLKSSRTLEKALRFPRVQVKDNLRIFDGKCGTCQKMFDCEMVHFCETCKVKTGHEFPVFCTAHGHDESHYHFLVENVHTGLVPFHGRKTDLVVTVNFFPTNFNILVRGCLLTGLSNPETVHVTCDGSNFLIDLDAMEQNGGENVIASVSALLSKWNADWFGNFDGVEQIIAHLNASRTLQQALEFPQAEGKYKFPFEEQQRIVELFGTHPKFSLRYCAEFLECEEMPMEFEIPVWTFSYEQWVNLNARVKVWLKEEEEEKERIEKAYAERVQEELKRIEEEEEKPKAKKKTEKKKKATKKRARSPEKKKKLFDRKTYNSSDPEQRKELVGSMQGILDANLKEREMCRDLLKNLSGKVTNAEMAPNVDIVNEYTLLDPKELAEKWLKLEEEEENFDPSGCEGLLDY